MKGGHEERTYLYGWAAKPNCGVKTQEDPCDLYPKRQDKIGDQERTVCGLHSQGGLYGLPGHDGLQSQDGDRGLRTLAAGIPKNVRKNDQEERNLLDSKPGWRSVLLDPRGRGAERK